MWDDVIIGNGPQRGTAIGIGGIGETRCRIAQDDVSYWISAAILDLEAKIFKDTEAGIKLQLLIRQKSSAEEIDDHVNQSILKHISFENFKKALEKNLKESYEKGKKDKALEICKSLGI